MGTGPTGFLTDYLTEERFRVIFKEELKEHEDRMLLRLQSYGLDTTNPHDQQLDLIHLRRWRTIVESTGMRAVLTIITVAVTGVLGWLGLLISDAWTHK